MKRTGITAKTAVIVSVIALLTVVISGGCSGQKRGVPANLQDDKSASGPVVGTCVSILLPMMADSQQVVDPQRFAFRSNWPSSLGASYVSEVTTFRETWHDRQTVSPYRDFSYRHFRSYRRGVHVR